MSIIFKKIALIIIILSPGILLQVLYFSDYLNFIRFFLEANILFYLPLTLITKIMGVIYPPFPGTLMTFSAVPLIGWETAYFIDILGSFIGASTSFFLGKKYGYKLMLIFLGDRLVDKIKKIRLKKHNQIEASIILRFASIGILSDGIVWGASTWGFRYATFIIGYMIAHLVTTLPLFILLGVSVSFSSWVVTIVIGIIAWGLLYQLKGRYFE